MGGGGSGGGGSSTTVQKADPWSGVQPYLLEGYKMLQNLYAPNGQLGQGPQYFPGQTVATPNALEQQGQNAQLGAVSGLDQLGQTGAGSVGSMAGLGQSAAAGGGGAALDAIGNLNSTAAGILGQGGNLSQFGLGGSLQGMNQLLAAGDPSSNPFFQQAMQSAIRPVTEQFTEQVLPGIKSGAMQAGQLGGSRQGIAEGIASRGYLDTIGDITANMGSQAYGQGLQAVQAGAGIGQGLLGQGGNLYGLGMSGLQGAGQLGSGLFGTGLEGLGRAAALAPTAQQGLLAGGQLQEQIGQQRTADEQAQIDAAMQKWNYEQMLPYSQLSDYLSILAGAPGGTTSAYNSGTGGGGQNRLLSGLGGAASGYGLATGLGLAGPWGWGAAALGGALGLFG